MRIEIQAYWGTKVQSIQSKLIPEEALKKYGNIYICDVVIDKELVGVVVWDGKKLYIKANKKDAPGRNMAERPGENRKL